MRELTEHITQLRIRIDASQLSIMTFDDPRGIELQQQWKDYIDSRVLPNMNPATLYQMDRQF